MMLHEFSERTGFEPTFEEYAEIEEAYYQFDGSKDAFCKHFVESAGEKQIYADRVKKIEQLRSKMVEMEKDFMQTLKQKEQKIEKLTKELEIEQEWKPYDDDHNVKQSEYTELATSSSVKELTDDEAADMIANEFGFDRSKIVIVHEVAKCEINRHNRTRTVGTYERKALFDAWDWNYICFNIHGNTTMGYEMHNGELQKYWG